MVVPNGVSRGGVRGGQVIGKSTGDGGDPATENVTRRHLIVTIMQTVFDVGVLRVTRGVPTPILQLAQPDPIAV